MSSPGAPGDRREPLRQPPGRRPAPRAPVPAWRQRDREELLRDRLRQMVVAMAAASGLLGLQVLAGRAGAPVADLAEGALAGDATVLASGSPAPVTLTLCGVSLVAWAAWHVLPESTSAPRQRAAGWWMASAMALLTLWLVLVETGWLWVALGALLAVTVSLERAVRGLDLAAPRSRAEAVVVDGVAGGFLGWCLVACPTGALAAASTSLDARGAGAQVVAVLAVVLVAAAAGWVVLGTGRVAVAVGTAWGLLWIAGARVVLGPESTAVVLAAALGAAVPLVALLVARRRRPPGTVAEESAGRAGSHDRGSGRGVRAWRGAPRAPR